MYDIKISEVIRLLTQALQALGLNRTASVLQNESAVPLEDQSVLDFRRAVLTGDWGLAENVLPSLYPKELQDAQLLLRRQKFVEQIEAHQNVEALKVLQTEVAPLETDQERLHQMARNKPIIQHLLCSLLFCSNEYEIQGRMTWSGSEIRTREQLLGHLAQYIHPTMMLPHNRLFQLLAQALEWQRLQCVYHDGDPVEDDHSLLMDHLCVQDKFPSRTLKILRGHTDEVWYIAFSNDGNYLASVSKDNKCIIWNMEVFRDAIQGDISTDSIFTYCAWSPDDSRLLMCNCDHSLCLWGITAEVGIFTVIKAHTDQVTCCAWWPDSQRFITGACDNKLFCWDVNGNTLSVRKGNRPVDMKITADGTRMVTASFDRHIIIYSLYFYENEHNMVEICRIPEQEAITSLSLSLDGRFAVVNAQTVQEVHLWDLNRQRLMKRYKAHKHNAYVIRSCIGGKDETFIISGSEDNKIYVWNREKQNLLVSLDGHSNTVNCVVWCPTSPSRFASASDDKTIRM
ncbi:WD40-repeat-containing domain protein [Fennellomyces sp. T-0311]|nr:WD40-repeat-containing domain protein [Fennellomyces sp. T-0311]